MAADRSRVSESSAAAEPANAELYVSRHGLAANRWNRFVWCRRASGPLGREQLREVRRLDPRPRSPSRRSRSPPCARHARCAGCGDEVAVNQGLGKGVAEVRQPRPSVPRACRAWTGDPQHEAVAGRGVSEAQPAGRSPRARSRGGPGSGAGRGRAGPRPEEFRGVHWTAASQRPARRRWSGSAGENFAARVVEEQPPVLVCRRLGLCRSSAHRASATAAAVPRRRRLRPPRSCACRSLRSRRDPPGPLLAAGRPRRGGAGSPSDRRSDAASRLRETTMPALRGGSTARRTRSRLLCCAGAAEDAAIRPWSIAVADRSPRVCSGGGRSWSSCAPP